SSGRPALSSAASSWLKTMNSPTGMRPRRPPRHSAGTPSDGAAPRRLTSNRWYPRLPRSLRRAISSLAVMTSSSTRPSGVPTRQMNCIVSLASPSLFAGGGGVAFPQGQHEHQRLGARLAAGDAQAGGVVDRQHQVRVQELRLPLALLAAGDAEAGE